MKHFPLIKRAVQMDNSLATDRKEVATAEEK
jgi:hypothetical protein